MASSSPVSFGLHRFPESVLCLPCVVGLDRAMSERCPASVQLVVQGRRLGPFPAAPGLRHTACQGPRWDCTPFVFAG